MEMFFTKRELLRYLGKNENDNKLVDRMIKRGEVVKVADGYDIVENDTEALKKRIKELEWKLKDNEALGALQVKTEQGNNTLLDSEILSHLEYLLMLNEKKNEVIKEIINMIYLKHQDKGWDYAVELMSKQFGYEPDPSEEDELNFIKELLNK